MKTREDKGDPSLGRDCPNDQNLVRVRPDRLVRDEDRSKKDRPSSSEAFFDTSSSLAILVYFSCFGVLDQLVKGLGAAG